MVLDGALDPTADPVAELVRQGEGFQGAFEAYAKDCASTAGCPLGADPAGATDRFRALVNPLIDAPAPTSGPRALGYNDATIGTIQALYSPQLWSLLTQGLTELTRGRGGTRCCAWPTSTTAVTPTAATPTPTTPSPRSRCVDDPPGHRPGADLRRRNAATGRWRRSSTTAGARVPRRWDTCAFWPVPPSIGRAAHGRRGGRREAPADGGGLHHGRPGDPRTRRVSTLAEQLDARLITFTGDQHTVVLDGRACVDDAVAKYLVELTPPEAGLRC